MIQQASETGHGQTRYAPPAGATEFILARHGASEPYVPGQLFPLVNGHGDPALSAEGQAQALLLGQRLLTTKLDAVYVTNLRRTAQTVAPFLARSGMQAGVVPELREIYLGDWEGGRLREFAAQLHPTWAKVVADGEWGHIPNAETSAQLQSRCVAALQLLHNLHVNQRVLCVVHGGVIGALLAYAAGTKGRTFDGSDNCSLHTVVLQGNNWQIRRFNETAHLDVD